VTLLREAAPGVGFVGEEGLDASTPGAPTWVIDPIDGTHNYVRGYPGFCVSVGLVVGGESVLGVIYDSVDDAVYWAVRGAGAWRDDAPLRRGPPRPLSEALVGTNFTAESAASAADQRVFAELARRAAGVRSSGAACRDWCLLASGRSDLFWQFGLKAWDVAAGLVLVREAGGAMRFGDAPADWVHAPGLAAFAGEPAWSTRRWRSGEGPAGGERVARRGVQPAAPRRSSQARSSAASSASVSPAGPSAPATPGVA
jgi:fructose-1,6-bisphosphatase/inositol monophosphatase family enzyme